MPPPSSMPCHAMPCHASSCFGATCNHIDEGQLSYSVIQNSLSSRSEPNRNEAAAGREGLRSPERTPAPGCGKGGGALIDKKDIGGVKDWCTWRNSTAPSLMELKLTSDGRKISISGSQMSSRSLVIRACLKIEMGAHIPHRDGGQRMVFVVGPGRRQRRHKPSSPRP